MKKKVSPFFGSLSLSLSVCVRARVSVASCSQKLWEGRFLSAAKNVVSKRE